MHMKKIKVWLCVVNIGFVYHYHSREWLNHGCGDFGFCITPDPRQDSLRAAMTQTLQEQLSKLKASRACLQEALDSDKVGRDQDSYHVVYVKKQQRRYASREYTAEHRSEYFIIEIYYIKLYKKFLNQYQLFRFTHHDHQLVGQFYDIITASELQCWATLSFCWDCDRTALIHGS